MGGPDDRHEVMLHVLSGLYRTVPARGMPGALSVIDLVEDTFHLINRRACPQLYPGSGHLRRALGVVHCLTVGTGWSGE